MEDDDDQGSLLLGIALGFVLNCIGIVIAFAMRGQRTLTGALIGTVLAIVLLGCFGLAMITWNLVTTLTGTG